MKLFLCAQNLWEIWIGLTQNEKFTTLIRFDSPPEQYLCKLNQFVLEQSIDLPSLKGISIVTGPGSFTASRISLTMANTLHFIYGFPIFVLENEENLSPNDLWQKKGFGRCLAVNEYAHPYYHRGPHITKPSMMIK